MHRDICGGILALALLAGLAGTSSAQETGTPIFKAPYRAFTSHELGASLSDPGEGVSFALEGFYRYGQGPNDFSLRGGFEDLNGSAGTRVLLGGDFRTQVVSYSESFPLDGSLTVGFGGSVARKRVVFRRSPNATWVIIAVPMLCQRLTPRSSTTRPPMAFGHRARNAVR